MRVPSQTGTTAGEIYLFGMIHQAVLAGGAPALGNMRAIRGGSVLVYPRLKGWCKLTQMQLLFLAPWHQSQFNLATLTTLHTVLCTDDSMLKEDAIKKVLAGESVMGAIEVYFVDTPTFNKKNGIEDDSGYGEANGYGTVRQLDCR